MVRLFGNGTVETRVLFDLNSEFRSRRTRVTTLLLFTCVSDSSKVAHDDIDGFEHFERHGWLMNVLSVHNYTYKGCLFGGQLKVHLDTVYMVKHSSRGWVPPYFVHVRFSE